MRRWANHILKTYLLERELIELVEGPNNRWDCFIGSYVVARLLAERGDRPILYNYKPSTKRLKGIEDKVEVYRGDVLDGFRILEVAGGGLSRDQDYLHSVYGDWNAHIF